MPASSPLAPAELARVPLFADLDPDQHQRLLEQHRTVTFAGDQPLVLEEDEGQALFLLRQGLLKVRCFDFEGEETVLALLGPGDVCGEMAVLNALGRRSADVVCLTPCQLVILRSGPFVALLRTEPRLALALARLQASRLRALNRRFGLRGADATTRLLATLADLALHASVDGQVTDPIPPLPQREIALITGLARETASRTLSRLRQRGTVIATADGGLQFQDLEPLRRRGLLDG